MILDQSIIKLWFNYDHDIKALDATLDEIYRGTVRQPFTSGGGAWPEQIRNPSYKLRLMDGQERLFSRRRPAWLTFRDDSTQSCPYNFHGDGVNNFGQPCPCRTNNLNLRVVVEFIMRNIGINPRPHHASAFTREPWTEHRIGGNYARFEECILHGDKHSRLLARLKRRPRLAQPIYSNGLCPVPAGGDGLVPRGCEVDPDTADGGLGRLCIPTCPNNLMFRDYEDSRREADDIFFRRFRNPNYVQDFDLLGYAVGDVIGLAMAARFLMTTENPRL